HDVENRLEAGGREVEDVESDPQVEEGEPAGADAAEVDAERGVQRPERRTGAQHPERDAVGEGVEADSDQDRPDLHGYQDGDVELGRMRQEDGEETDQPSTDREIALRLRNGSGGWPARDQIMGGSRAQPTRAALVLGAALVARRHTTRCCG